MNISLKNYTLRYLTIAFLVIIAIWALVFYAYILDEVYDNVDDGLKNQKIEILREVYKHSEILKTDEFGVNQFRIIPAKAAQFSETNKFYNTFFYMPYDEEEEPYRVLKTGFYGPDEKPYYLEIRTSTVEEDDLIYDLTTALIVLYIVLLLSLYIINEFVLRRAWKPFKTILENLNHYRFGKKENLRPLKTNVIEFNKLYNEIGQMWKRNEEIFNEQKLFIENASHELQTPLAITINKLELLMEGDGLTENQLVQLNDSKSSLMRLVNLNKALLMLSRIENKQYKDVELVSFNDVLKQLLDDFNDLIKFKEIQCLLKEEGVFEIEMNKDLVTVLLSNLLRNAIRYNFKGGSISIHLSKKSLSIKNTGENRPLEQSLIFQRFHKEQQDSKSNGLGLAIVKSIVDSYSHLSIHYYFENKKHIFLLERCFS